MRNSMTGETSNSLKGNGPYGVDRRNVYLGTFFPMLFAPLIEFAAVEKKKNTQVKGEKSADCKDGSRTPREDV
ncbi:hypothetical protein TNCV_2261271 [Trichonephila clavipes]|nr:hypothetical protein TNCV_2261271 [Trichonephila clavipes]